MSMIQLFSCHGCSPEAANYTCIIHARADTPQASSRRSTRRVIIIAQPCAAADGGWPRARLV